MSSYRCPHEYKKSVLDKCDLSRTDFIRGATLNSERKPLCSRRNTNIFPATYVCLHVRGYSASAFHPALSGPFNELRWPVLIPSGSLCMHDIVFTSASQVYHRRIKIIEYMITLLHRPVNSVFYAFAFYALKKMRKQILIFLWLYRFQSC